MWEFCLEALTWSCSFVERPTAQCVETAQHVYGAVRLLVVMFARCVVLLVGVKSWKRTLLRAQPQPQESVEVSQVVSATAVGLYTVGYCSLVVEHHEFEV